MRPLSHDEVLDVAVDLAPRLAERADDAERDRRLQDRTSAEAEVLFPMVVPKALGGLGGCPFAPGATGNVPIEDLAHAFSHMGIRTGLDLAALISAAELACRLVNRPVSSHVGIAGPRFADVGPDRGEAT